MKRSSAVSGSMPLITIPGRRLLDDPTLLKKTLPESELKASLIEIFNKHQYGTISVCSVKNKESYKRKLGDPSREYDFVLREKKNHGQITFDRTKDFAYIPTAAYTLEDLASINERKPSVIKHVLTNESHYERKIELNIDLLIDPVDPRAQHERLFGRFERLVRWFHAEQFYVGALFRNHSLPLLQEE